MGGEARRIAWNLIGAGQLQKQEGPCLKQDGRRTDPLKSSPDHVYDMAHMCPQSHTYITNTYTLIDKIFDLNIKFFLYDKYGNFVLSRTCYFKNKIRLHPETINVYTQNVPQ